MLFNSWVFVVFFATVLILHWPRNRRWQNILLLVASYVFYGYWDWRFLGLLLLSTVVDYTAGVLMPSATLSGRRRLLIASLMIQLGILGFFKYFNFFVGSAAALLGSLGFEVSLPILSIVLPVGVSFYTFQTMAYTIDVYRGRIEPARDFILFGVYVSFFPQLVAGPIERAQNLLPQFSRPRRATKEQVASGALLILIGLARKVAIADVAAPFVDEVFGDPSAASGLAVLAGVLLFSLQIYGDFAGYTDIARGTGRILGIELMENFNHPYFAVNIADFWRRWHISLSTWLRDYLYVPLGGNREGRGKTYRNLMLTMLLGGLWHGAAWTFVVWGGIHGVALVVQRWWHEKRPRGADLSMTDRIGAWALTMVIVVLAWVFFRSSSVESAMEAFYAIATFTGGFDREGMKLMALFLALLVLTLMIDVPQALGRDHVVFLRWPVVARGLVYAGLILVILLAPSGANVPFIYFQF